MNINEAIYYDGLRNMEGKIVRDIIISADNNDVDNAVIIKTQKGYELRYRFNESIPDVERNKMVKEAVGCEIALNIDGMGNNKVFEFNVE